MDLHNRRLDRIMYRNPVGPDWYSPVQEWSCPRCQKSCAYKHCPRCPHISCPLQKSFKMNQLPVYQEYNDMYVCPYCKLTNCQCALNRFSSQVCDRYKRMRQIKMMEERRERMTQFFVFLMIVFFVVIFVTCMIQTK